MCIRKITQNIDAIISTHWERRLFDSLIPLPDGTSYNAYLVKVSEKTALIDSTDPELREELLTPLKGVGKIDYLVSHHTEQDHSGVLPDLLELYPEAKLLCSKKAEELLITHLAIHRERLQIVEDGETLSLGNLTLKFIMRPGCIGRKRWSPMFLKRCLFSCDLYGSHLAMTDLVHDKPRSMRRQSYYSEIMMPFRKIIQKNMESWRNILFRSLREPCPIHAEPEFILEAYRDWVSDKVKTRSFCRIPVCMAAQRNGQVSDCALTREGVTVYPRADCHRYRQLATALVDAATLIVAT